jgi:hypothetical protein
MGLTEVHVFQVGLTEVRVFETWFNSPVFLPPLIPRFHPFLELRQMFGIGHLFFLQSLPRF